LYFVDNRISLFTTKANFPAKIKMKGCAYIAMHLNKTLESGSYLCDGIDHFVTDTYQGISTGLLPGRRAGDSRMNGLNEIIYRGETYA